MRFLVLAFFIATSCGAAACDYPDEGTMPLHRAVTKVKLLPATEAWSAEQLKRNVVVQYALFLEPDVRVKGRCYWTVEARAEGVTWRRFLVRPDGRTVLSETGGPLERDRQLPAAGR
jgi:hypothetical protein